MTTKDLNRLKKLLNVSSKEFIVVEAYKQYKVDAKTEEEVLEQLQKMDVII